MLVVKVRLEEGFTRAGDSNTPCTVRRMHGTVLSEGQRPQICPFGGTRRGIVIAAAVAIVLFHVMFAVERGNTIENVLTRVVVQQMVIGEERTLAVLMVALHTANGRLQA